LSLGRKRGDKTLLGYGYRTLAIIARERGELVRSLELLEHASAFSLEDPYASHPLLGKLWIDRRVSDQIHKCLIGLLRGDGPRAWQYGLEALARARRLDGFPTQLYALSYLAAAAQYLRDTPRVLEWAEECLRVASRMGFRPMQAAANAIRGWALARLGRYREGLELLLGAIEHLWRMGEVLLLPYFEGLLAEVQGSGGQVREGLSSVEAALRHTDETGARLFEAELHRLRGELLRLLGDSGEALRCFLRARLVARRQQAALLELRATVALARLLRDTGHDAQARRRLARALHASRVDPEAVDFQGARVLLEQLSVQPEALAAL